jgi:hypothetical protein
MLWTFLNSKNYNYFKSSFKHLKIYICKKSFDIFLMCFIASCWNWKWKKKLLSISPKYSYLKLIFNYTRKKLWKKILICWNCDTLVCFLPCPKWFFGPIEQGAKKPKAKFCWQTLKQTLNFLQWLDIDTN